MTDTDPGVTISIIKDADDPNAPPNEPGVNQNEQKDTPAEEQPKEQENSQDQPVIEPTGTGPEAGEEEGEDEESDEGASEENIENADEEIDSEEDSEGSTASQYAALANPSGVQTVSGGGGGAGGGGNNGPTAPTGPRSPRFNIYETDQLDKGGVPFSDAALQLFSNFGKGFTKLCHKINSAALGVFSKPISSCRVLGEALVDIGELMSGTMHELAQKDTGLTPLGQAVKHNNMQDHAAA